MSLGEALPNLRCSIIYSKVDDRRTVRRYGGACNEREGSGSYDLPHVEIHHTVTQPASTIDVNSPAWLNAHMQRKPFRDVKLIASQTD